MTQPRIEDTDVGCAERDAQLVARIRLGDAHAFDALARALVPGLCAFAMRYVASRETAEEVVQEVLCRVWVNRARLVVHDTLATYLYRAVRNQALNAVRDRATRNGALARVEWMRAADRDSETGLADAESHVQSTQLGVALRRAVEQLPERWKLAFQLVREHQLSRAEAASIMGVTVKSIDMALGRAVKALRASLRGVWP